MTVARVLEDYTGGTRLVDRDPHWLIWDVASGDDGVSAEVILRSTEPDNYTYLDAYVQCVQGDVGAASTKLNLKHGSTTIFTGQPDNGGNIHTDRGVINTPLPSPMGGYISGNLIADVDISGTPSTEAVWRIHLLASRFGPLTSGLP